MKTTRTNRSKIISTLEPQQRKRTRQSDTALTIPDSNHVNGTKLSKRIKESHFVPEPSEDDVIQDVQLEVDNSNSHHLEVSGFELGFRFKDSASTLEEEKSKDEQKAILRQMVQRVLQESPKKLESPSQKIETPSRAQVFFRAESALPTPSHTQQMHPSIHRRNLIRHGSCNPCRLPHPRLHRRRAPPLRPSSPPAAMPP